LGLHRDGERLGLSPFHSEIRRRLWWHLLSRDSRAGEDYGLENTNSLLRTTEVNLPTNIDDTDLYPGVQQLPAPKVGWTAMTFSLINIDLAKSMQKVASAAASSSASVPPNENVRAQIIEETKLRIEERLSKCNPVIPQQRLAILCSRFLIRKLNFITRIQWILLQRTDPNADFATEENLIEALEILEPRLGSEDGLLEQFAWARKAYPQYHVAMYVLWHLCHKPEGPSIDRAWRAIKTLFSEELLDESAMGFGSKSAVLTALKTKALSMREKIRRPNPEETPETGGRSLALAGEGLSEGEGLSAYMLGDTGGGQLGLDSGADEWANWEALVQGFQFDSPDILWQ